MKLYNKGSEIKRSDKFQIGGIFTLVGGVLGFAICLGLITLHHFLYILTIIFFLISLLGISFYVHGYYLSNLEKYQEEIQKLQENKN